MKNNRMKDKIKKMGTNKDLEFLMKGWGNPENTEALSKEYGEKQIIQDVSFEAQKGKIYGFLGPNGVGKSTTMNMITGYLPMSGGKVMIDGTDITESPVKAKRNIGYLPEIPPLYNDMTVAKYLGFMFDLKRVRLPKWEHITEICEMVKLMDVGDRIIKHLSKGYRQRVGFAQALLGYPPVLILDEPTVGLDPAQIIEMRSLIRELGKKHTIILSSHVLSEIEAVCDKIIIIDHGKIAAQGKISELTGSGKGTRMIRIQAEGREQSIYSVLKNIDSVVNVFKKGEVEKGCYEFAVESRTDIRRVLYRAVSKADFTILLMQPQGHTLEETYLDIISGRDI